MASWEESEIILECLGHREIDPATGWPPLPDGCGWSITVGHSDGDEMTTADIMPAECPDCGGLVSTRMLLSSRDKARARSVEEGIPPGIGMAIANPDAELPDEPSD